MRFLFSISALFNPLYLDLKIDFKLFTLRIIDQRNNLRHYFMQSKHCEFSLN